jgi:hypothetical protein
MRGSAYIQQKALILFETRAETSYQTGANFSIRDCHSNGNFFWLLAGPSRQTGRLEVALRIFQRVEVLAMSADD